MFLHVPARIASDRAASKQEPVVEGVLQQGETEVAAFVCQLSRTVRAVVAGRDVLRLFGVFAVGRTFGNYKLEVVAFVDGDCGLKPCPQMSVGSAELAASGWGGKPLAYNIGRVGVDKHVSFGGVEGQC